MKLLFAFLYLVSALHIFGVKRFSRQPSYFGPLIKGFGRYFPSKRYFSSKPSTLTTSTTQITSNPARNINFFRRLFSTNQHLEELHKELQNTLYWKKGNFDTIKTLLKQGADPNKRDPFGRTALHRLVEGNYNPEYIQSVIKLFQSTHHPVNINARTKDGESVLMKAAQNTAFPEVIDILVAQGANVKIQDQYGRDALYNALFKNNHSLAAPTIIKKLLEYGAKADQRDRWGDTLIERLAKDTYHVSLITNEPHDEEHLNNLTDTIKELIKHGASYNRRKLENEDPRQSDFFMDAFNRALIEVGEEKEKSEITSSSWLKNFFRK